jgi:hypothetical protein
MMLLHYEYGQRLHHANSSRVLSSTKNSEVLTFSPQAAIVAFKLEI